MESERRGFSTGNCPIGSLRTAGAKAGERRAIIESIGEMALADSIGWRRPPGSMLRELQEAHFFFVLVSFIQSVHLFSTYIFDLILIQY